MEVLVNTARAELVEARSRAETLEGRALPLEADAGEQRLEYDQIGGDDEADLGDIRTLTILHDQVLLISFFLN